MLLDKLNVKVAEKTKENFVFDISLDGTVVNALGMNIMSNTDGINMQLPSVFRYTDSHPYISNGNGRNTLRGKAYTGIEADVAEFDDLYLNKYISIDIDEIISMSINFKRKTYVELLDNGKVKLVGNMLKNKSMLPYINKFIKRGVEYLTAGNAVGFIDYYYDYIDKIYNYQMPLKDLASVGKINMDIDVYKERINTADANGKKKSRYIPYELAIKYNLDVKVGDVIYYVNIGNNKNVSDMTKRTSFYLNNQDMTKSYEAEYYNLKKECKKINKPFCWKSLEEYVNNTHKEAVHTETVILNCAVIDSSIVKNNIDTFCDNNFIYNADKYISIFNSSVSNFFMCFPKELRYKIREDGTQVENLMINKPCERKFFTQQECVLASDEYTEEQDTYEDVMRMEQKEIEFWQTANKR